MSANTLSWIFGLGNINREDENRERVTSESTAIDVRISVYPLGENHPLASVFGAFDDEPLWDDWMRAINEYRQEENARELQENGE